VAILDEIDSGLDRDALEVVGRALEHIRATQPSMAMLIITHYQRILSYIIPHHVHIMRAGLIVASGDMKLVQQIEAQGYESIQP
jgi:Fe-S cluster assembly ATP-binding protein